MPDDPRTRHLSLSRPPSLAAAYLRGIVDRRPRNVPEGRIVPVIETSLTGLSADPERVAAFRRVCGLPPGDGLPLTYPHVMAAGMHLRMLLDPAFPVRLAGVVHVWHRVHRHAPVPSDALDFRCSLGDHAVTAIGDEFRLRTEVRRDGRLLWSEDTGFAALAPRRRSAPRPGDAGPAAERGTAEPSGAGDGQARWRVPADTGRRYARVSGDWNPIHLYGLTARLFGFHAPIAHGMWTLARCAGDLGSESLPAVELEARFLKPLLMPAEAALERTTTDTEIRFRLGAASGGTPWLTGRMAPG